MRTLCASLVIAAWLVPSIARAADPEPISNVACLRKMALDLTDRGPSAQEVADLTSGAKSLDAFADGYLASPQFSQVAFDWFRATFAPTIKVPASADVEEPARIARYLVTNDRDFRELVTGGYTVTASGQTTTLGADAAGILTTQNYMSAYSGVQNRNWAGQLLRGMAGIVLMAVSTVPPGTDASRSGIAANPACAGCHTNPIYGVDHAAAFRDCYDTSGLRIAGCAQANVLEFLGESGQTMPDLGRILAGSVEWRAKMIQSFYERLMGRQIGQNEIPEYRASETAWLAAGYRPKELVKQIVRSTSYCSR
jgi:hypothetical protein